MQKTDDWPWNENKIDKIHKIFDEIGLGTRGEGMSNSWSGWSN